MVAEYIQPLKEALCCRSIRPWGSLSAFEGKRLPANNLMLAPLSQFEGKLLPGNGRASP